MLVKHMEANKHGRDFVVGDVHGELDLLTRLMEMIGFDKSVDRLFGVGDLIDRGPDSLGVVALLREPWFFSVRGNHEDMMLRALTGNDAALRMWLNNGGLWVHGELTERPEGVDDAADLVDALPLVIVVGGAWQVAHAELLVTDEDVDAGIIELQGDVLWARELIAGKDKSPGFRPTFVGHTPVANVKRRDNHYFIDTGGTFNGRLTAVEPRTMKVWTT